MNVYLRSYSTSLCWKPLSHSLTCCPYLLSLVLCNCLAGEGIAKNKRLKLEYAELLPSNSSANEMWNKLLTEEGVIDKDDLTDAVKFGTS